MLFVDGVGIGRRDSQVNPFFRSKLPTLRWVLGGEMPSLRRRSIAGRLASLVPLDATLGVPGLPQSGTGQTALFTGVNGAKLVGKHFGPYPYSTLRPVIEHQSIFRRLVDAGKLPCFANAFPERFFDYMKRRPGTVTVSTLSYLMAGRQLLRAEDLRAGRGVSGDVTNQAWSQLGYTDIPMINPAEAGRRLAALSEEYDLVLFEYWKTDEAGHSRSMAQAVDVLELFDAMLEGILSNLNTGRTVLFLSSDHGNIEDMSTKMHTRNPVPALMFGPGHEKIAARFAAISHRSPVDITVVTPFLLDLILDRSFN